MFVLKQPILKKLYHNILATFCGCTLWYIVSEKITLTQTQEIPIFVYNTHNITDTFTCPKTAFITIALSPSSLLSLPINSMGVHIDTSILSPNNSTILIDYESAIVLPAGVKIVHCNPIIIHKIEKNTVI